MSSSLWPMDCILPGSSIHEIFQARILEWVAISFSKVSSRSREWNFHLLGLLHGQVNFLLLCHLGSPVNSCKLQKEKCWGVINARRAESLNSPHSCFWTPGLRKHLRFCLFGFCAPAWYSYGLQDLSSLTRHWAQATAVTVPSPNHWITRELSPYTHLSSKRSLKFTEKLQKQYRKSLSPTHNFLC